MTKEPIIVERTLQSTPEKVWAALTESGQMKHWYFDVGDFHPEAGFDFTFKGENEGRVFVHLCRITEVIPFQKLTHSWRYEGVEGVSFVTFELTPSGDGTSLKLTHDGLETFPQNKDLKRDNFLHGWTAIIGTNLPAYLAQTQST